VNLIWREKLISKMDQMVKMKTEDVKEIFEKGFLEPIPGPHFGGLITDPIPARVRKLEERVKALEIFTLKVLQSMESGECGGRLILCTEKQYRE